MGDNIRNNFNIFKYLLSKERGLISFIAIILSVFIYLLTTEFFTTDFGIIQYLPKNETYDFYAGTKGSGVYYTIGQVVKEKSKEGGIKFKAVETNGSYENALKVLSQSEKAITLVQEGSYPESSIIRKELDYPVPLYLERMHIFYNKTKYKQYCDKYNKHCLKEKLPKKPILSTYTHPAVLSFLLKDSVAVGKVGSGTRVLAGVVLKELTKQVRKLSCDNAPSDCNSLKNFKLRNISTSESLPIISLNTDKSDADRISVGFGIAGAPYKTALNYLNNKNIDIGLMGIDPMLISELNIQYNLNLEATNFKGKYNKENDETSTLATFCYLATKKNTDPYAIKAFLKTIRDNRKDVYDEIGLYSAKQNSSDKKQNNPNTKGVSANEETRSTLTQVYENTLKHFKNSIKAENKDTFKHFYKNHIIELLDNSSTNEKVFLQFENSNLISKISKDGIDPQCLIIEINRNDTNKQSTINFILHPTASAHWLSPNCIAIKQPSFKGSDSLIILKTSNIIIDNDLPKIITDKTSIDMTILSHPIKTAKSYNYEINPNLDEFDFVDYYKPAFDKWQFIIRNFIFFILSIFPLFFLFSFFATSIISTIKFDYYHNRIANIRKDNIPHNALLSIEYIGTSTLEELAGYKEDEREILNQEISKHKKNIVQVKTKEIHISYLTNIIRMLENLISYNKTNKLTQKENKHKYKHIIKDQFLFICTLIFLVISSFLFYKMGSEDALQSWNTIKMSFFITLLLFIFGQLNPSIGKPSYYIQRIIHFFNPLLILALFFIGGDKLSVLLMLVVTLS